MDITISPEFAQYLLRTLEKVPADVLYDLDIKKFKNQILNKNLVLFPVGIEDIDLEIMLELKDKVLLNSCQLNKYTANLCRNENFWHKKIINKYGQNISQYKPVDTTYKQIYLGLANKDKFKKLLRAIEWRLLPIVKKMSKSKVYNEESSSDDESINRSIESAQSVAAINGYIETLLYTLDKFGGKYELPYYKILQHKQYALIGAL